MFENKFLKEKIEPSLFKKSFNRWIELGFLNNNKFLKFYPTSLINNYVGGYLSRSSYKNSYCIIPFFNLQNSMYKLIKDPRNNSLKCLNRWIILNSYNYSFPFFLTHIDKNFIGGYLPLNIIVSLDASILDYQNFFEEYDMRFHPKLLSENKKIPIEEQKKRIQIVELAESILLTRLKKRILFSKDKKVPSDNEIPSLGINDIQYLSIKQLDLYKEFFLNKNNELDYKRIQRCFELFNNGEIQNNKYPGNLQPDSASEFLFAEFALQAIEKDINSEVWGELLKSFVKTQEIFIQVYRPKGVKKPKLFDYDYSNFRYYKQVTEATKEKLRIKYDDMSKRELEKAYSENLWEAYHSNSVNID